MAIIRSYIAQSGVVGAPIKYAWDEDTGVGFIGEKDQNIKLYDAIDSICYKGKATLGVAINEWIAARYEGLVDLSDIWKRLEATRASAIHFRYCKDLTHEPGSVPDLHPDPKIDGPLQLLMYFIGDVDMHYAAGDIYLAEAIVRAATMARYVLNKSKAFGDWLEWAIRRAAKELPKQPPYPEVDDDDDDEPKYDSTGEPPIPIEFFDPQFVYTPAASKAALRAFLKTLDPKKNPYLNTPKQMLAKGFTGKPYSL